MTATAGAMRRDGAIPARAWLLLVLACLALYLPGFTSLPPIDRDEARFAQASKQMVETGDLVDIRYQDEPRYKKPVGIYWLQAAAATLSGQGAAAPIWVYRLPSLLGAILAVLLTAWLGAGLFDRRTGVTAGMLLAASLLMGVEARLAKTDAVLLACILAAQLGLARAWGERDSAEEPAILPALGFWLALGAGMLVKGPIILLACGGTALLLSLFRRSGRWLLRLRPAFGVPLAVLVVLPWLVAIGLQSDGAFFQASVGHDLLGKVLSSQESHGAPPGYYAVAVWLTFWPGSLLLFLALPWIWRHRRAAPVQFCLAWIIPLWIVFELVLTKLPHYVLPAYPALALLSARALADGLPAPGTATAAARWARRLRVLVLPVWALLGIALTAAVILLPRLLGAPASPLTVILALLLLAAAGGAGWSLHRGRLEQIPLLLAAAAVAFALAGFDRLLPNLGAIWPSAQLAARVEAARADCPTDNIASAGYREPSLVFLLGTGTVLTTPEGAARHLMGSDRCALALVESREEPAFLAALPEVDPPFVKLATVSGFNYSNGRFVEIGLYRFAR